MNKLDQLRSMTTVVADTGELDAIEAYAPQDATTNPTLVLKAVEQPRYAHLLENAIDRVNSEGLQGDERVTRCCEWLAVLCGHDILQVIPGRISTEVDARLSFDTEASIAKAKSLMAMYNELGVSKDRVLIKIASTWEGIQAARALEAEGINTNLTLLFSFTQAQACADAGVFLISPFVGRILDWFKKDQGREFAANEDPGVLSVQRIWNYFRAYGYDTIVMGASFRSKEEIEELAGCDYLTIGPKFLEELKNDEGDLLCRLDKNNAVTQDEQHSPSETEFRWGMNEDAMATEKLSEGIRLFAQDQVRLEALVREALG